MKLQSVPLPRDHAYALVERRASGSSRRRTFRCPVGFVWWTVSFGPYVGGLVRGSDATAAKTHTHPRTPGSQVGKREWDKHTPYRYLTQNAVVGPARVGLTTVERNGTAVGPIALFDRANVLPLVPLFACETFVRLECGL